MRPTIIAVDWGKDVAKRAAFVARPARNGYTVSHLPPPPAGHRVASLLAAAADERRRSGGSVLVGIDAVLGAPRRFLQATSTNHPSSGFLDFLRRVAVDKDLVGQSPPGSWSTARPFFTVPAGKGSFDALVAQAGGRDMLWRTIDGPTRAKPVFALSGIPGTVGSGSRALWHELLPLLGDAMRERFSLWPFDGPLDRLMAQSPVVLAEIYPRAMYAVALQDQLPSPAVHVAKTRSPARNDALERLARARWHKELGISFEDLDRAAADEDAFDAFVSAAALARLAEMGRLRESGFADPCAEGDMLGLDELDFDAKVVEVRGQGEAASPAPRPVGTPSRPVVRAPAAAGRRYACPIDGCDHVFVGSRGGWDAHVGSPRLHPNWYPEATDPEERKRLFRAAFPGWFRS